MYQLHRNPFSTRSVTNADGTINMDTASRIWEIYENQR